MPSLSLRLIAFEVILFSHFIYNLSLVTLFYSLFSLSFQSLSLSLSLYPLYSECAPAVTHSLTLTNIATRHLLLALNCLLESIVGAAGTTSRGRVCALRHQYGKLVSLWCFLVGTQPETLELQAGPGWMKATSSKVVAPPTCSAAPSRVYKKEKCQQPGRETRCQDWPRPHTLSTNPVSPSVPTNATTH